jgi:hypothetical protein
VNDNNTLADDLRDELEAARKDSLALMALLAAERKKIDRLREVANTKGVRSEEMASAVHAVLAPPSTSKGVE